MRPVESYVAQPVRSLQNMLRTLSEFDQQLPIVIPDGVFGKQTQNAVSTFQRQNGLPVTGVADQNTWEKIADAYTIALIHQDAAEPLQVILNPGKVIQKGESGYNIYIVQVILKALADVYGSNGSPDVTGTLDAQTSEALLSFQYLHGLPQTGEVDKVTWQALALQYPLAVNHVESENTTRHKPSDQK